MRRAFTLGSERKGRWSSETTSGSELVKEGFCTVGLVCQHVSGMRKTSVCVMGSQSEWLELKQGKEGDLCRRASWQGC